MNESEYLDQQAEEAKAAIRATIGDIFTEAGETIDPRRWTQAHPWKAMALAAAAGFALSASIASRKAEEKKGEWTSWRDWLSEKAHSEHAHSKDEPDAKPQQDETPKHTFMNFLGMALKFVATIRPIVDAFLRPSPKDNTRNGSPPHDGEAKPGSPPPAGSATL